MHAELIFNMPEDEMAFRQACWATEYWQALVDLNEIVFNHHKYGHSLEKTFDHIETLLGGIQPVVEMLE